MEYNEENYNELVDVMHAFINAEIEKVKDLPRKKSIQSAFIYDVLHSAKKAISDCTYYSVERQY